MNEKVLQFLTVEGNEEDTKLFPVEEKPIKNCDTCIITHFENVDTVYVSNAYKNVKTSFDKPNNTG